MFKDLINCLTEISKTKSTIAKVSALEPYFRSLNIHELNCVLFILDPKNETKKLCNISDKLVLKAISELTNTDQFIDPDKAFEEQYLEIKKQNNMTIELSCSDVVAFINELTLFKGKDSTKLKLDLIKEHLLKVDLITGVYIIKLLTNDFRTGISTNLILKALAASQDIQYSDLKSKYNSGVSISKILLQDEFLVFRPMLAKAFDSQLHRKLDFTEYTYEYKYDGIRLVLTYLNNKLVLYSRNLLQLDLNAFVEKLINLPNENIILDCELLGVDFQTIITIVKRKHNLAQYSDLKLELKIFDILVYNLEPLINESYVDRKKLLKEWCIRTNNQTCFVQNYQVSEDLTALLKSERLKPYEGIILKKLNAPYASGKRNNDWIKLKKQVFEGDFLVISATKGSGFKSKWYTSFLLGAINDLESPNSTEIISIGNVGSGFTESNLDFLTEEITRLKLSESKNVVNLKPELIFQVEFQEVQRSASKNTYALRFPVYVSIRIDKSITEITKLTQLNALCSI